MTDDSITDFYELFGRIDEHNNSHSTGDMSYAAARLVEIDRFLDEQPTCPIARSVERILASEIRGVQVVVSGRRWSIGDTMRGVLARGEIPAHPADDEQAAIRSILLGVLLTHSVLSPYTKSRIMHRARAVGVV